MISDNKIKPLAEMVFIGEIVKQVKIAMRAAERLAATNQFLSPLGMFPKSSGLLEKVLMQEGRCYENC